MKKGWIIQKGLVLGLVLILCASPAGGAAAPQISIQEMINAAGDGGTVTIPGSVYYETLLVDKNLTLKGATNATAILTPGTANQRVIKVTGGHTLLLENLTIAGGHPTASGDDGGGGVYVMDGASLVVSQCIIDGNSASYGGGIFQEGAAGSVTISGSWITNNTAVNHGGGLYAAGSVTLTDTQLSGNTAGWHGGGLNGAGASTTLTGGVVSSNHATQGNGGGVNVNKGLSVNGTTFQSNTAGDSGGAITQWDAGQTVSISGAAFSVNSAKNNGGGVYIQSSFLTLASSSFTENMVDSGGAGSTSGGGLFAGGGLAGSGLVFSSNRATCTGCGINAGGGIAVNRPVKGPSSITLSTFDGNTAWFGSGISSGTNVELTVTDSSFINNGGPVDGGYGGGIDAYWLQGERLLFKNNRVVNNGAGINGSYLTLRGSRFLDNSSSAGSGGGIYASKDFSGINLLFANNDALSGAALAVNTGPAVLQHATISRATRGSESAIALVKLAGILEVKNSIISAYDSGIKFIGTLTEDYNLYFNNRVDFDPTGGGIPHYGAHGVALQDPLFANLAGADFHLRWPSPAIGKGTSLGVTADLDGQARIGRVDIGAYQYWASLYVPVIRK